MTQLLAERDEALELRRTIRFLPAGNPFDLLNLGLESRDLKVTVR